MINIKKKGFCNLTFISFSIIFWKMEREATMINRHQKKSFVVINPLCPFHHMLEDGKKGNNKNKNEVLL